MEKEIEKNVGIFFLFAIGSMILLILFYQQVSNLVSEEFIKGYMLILSISLFGLGFTALTMKDNRQLKLDLLNASIWTWASLLFGLIYLSDKSFNLLFNINFASLSLWAFLGGFFYFFLILIKERVNL